MPLLDHFHPPLSETRHWESFHARWASAIADALNESLLPAGYYAEEQVHVGGRVEIDVATFERDAQTRNSSPPGGTATMAVQVWTPPAPELVMPAVFPDSIEVLVFNGESGPTLVAAVELISPANKDRPETRRAFAAKCASYLQMGVGLVIVDTVTSRQGNLHNELVRLMETGEQFAVTETPLYGTAYRPVRGPSTENIEVWMKPLSIGRPLPTLPLAIDNGVVLPLDLESTYTDARARRRMQ